MNYLKIQNDILKSFIKSPTNKWYVACTEDKVFVSDGHTIYAIPKERFLLDTSNDWFTKTQTPISALLEDSNYIKASVSGDYKKLGPILTTVIKSDDTNEVIQVYIEAKKLNNFNKDCTFMVKSPLSAVLVLESEKIVGAILPIKMPKQ